MSVHRLVDNQIDTRRSNDNEGSWFGEDGSPIRGWRKYAHNQSRSIVSALGPWCMAKLSKIGNSESSFMFDRSIPFFTV